MSNFSSRKKRLFIFICVFLPLAIAVGAWGAKSLCGRSANDPPPDDGRMEEDLARLSRESYDSVLISMHSSRNFTSEDFWTYLNRNTLIASHTLLNVEELSRYLDCLLSSGNEVSHVYLCLDPELLWKTVGRKSAAWNSALADHLYSYIENYPDISFEVLLPYPHMDYWLSLSQKELDTLLTVYHTFVVGLSAYPNSKTYFPGGLYWLMVNPGNYEDTLFDANAVITQKLFLMAFCDGLYQVTAQNGDACWNALREIIARETETPSRYPDLSDWRLVFFGDSIFGNFPGSYSVPGYVSGLSDAVSYNCAIGGSSASQRPDNDRDFPAVIDGFFAENKLLLNDGSEMLYPDEFEKDDNKEKNICFIINFGTNDYFSGCAVENPQDPLDRTTYTGALRYCISRLQERFPNACYVLVSPTRLGVTTDSQRYPLTDYVTALEETAREMGVCFIDNYNDFVITEDNITDYLSDGCHPNEDGRLAMALRIMNFIDGLE